MLHAESAVPEPAIVEVPPRAGVDDDIRPSDQVAQGVTPVVGIQVERDPALAEVVVPEVEALVDVAGVSAERPVAARSLSPGRLDLDHVGTEAGEHLSTVLAEFISELQDADTFEKSHANS